MKNSFDIYQRKQAERIIGYRNRSRPCRFLCHVLGRGKGPKESVVREGRGLQCGDEKVGAGHGESEQ